MNTSDVIVIGGGIAGISAGAEIAKNARVTVLEREGVIGSHSTARSAAIFVKNYGNATLRALNIASEPFLLAPDGITDGTVLSPRGEMLIATEAELPLMANYLDGASGVKTLTVAEAQELVPVLRADRIAAVAFEPDAQDIDVDRLLQGYARTLRGRGGSIVVGAEVTAIRHAVDHWQVDTPAGTHIAPVIVNAAGAWADQIAALTGVQAVGLTPMRRSAAILPAPDGHDVNRWPMFAGMSEDWYAKPEAGKLMVSPADEDPVTPHDAWPDDMVLAEGLHRYEQAVTVPVNRVERSWAGLRSFVADRTPVVGFAPDAPGFLWLAGQGGYGIQTSPALSQLAAALVLGDTPRLDAAVLDALSPDRFAAID